MKIACLRCKRKLAEYAATDREIPTVGALAKHLAECPECARELVWFRAAHQDLQSSLTAKQVGAGFADATWARFSASARPRRSLASVGMVLSAACAATIAVTILIPNSPVRLFFRAPSRTVSATTTEISNRSTGQFGGKKSTENPSSGTAVATRQPEQNSGTQTVSWDQMASWYENQGDYQSAAAAYVQAAHANPNDSDVFNAGRTSECAGDVGQAIDYYASFLKHEHEQESQSRQEEPSRKGA